jgi:hypothetical protein
MSELTVPLTETMRDLQRKLADTLRRTAEVLDQSARLAEEDAERRASQHNTELEALERARAERARAGSRKARQNADRLDS